MAPHRPECHETLLLFLTATEEPQNELVRHRKARQRYTPENPPQVLFLLSASVAGYSYDFIIWIRKINNKAFNRPFAHFRHGSERIGNHLDKKPNIRLQICFCSIKPVHIGPLLLNIDQMGSLLSTVDCLYENSLKLAFLSDLSRVAGASGSALEWGVTRRAVIVVLVRCWC